MLLNLASPQAQILFMQDKLPLNIIELFVPVADISIPEDANLWIPQVFLLFRKLISPV